MHPADVKGLFRVVPEAEPSDFQAMRMGYININRAARLAKHPSEPKISTVAFEKASLHQYNDGPTEHSITGLSPQEVQANGLGSYRILDSSFHLPNSGRSAIEEFRKGPRLPNARLFDHEAIADTGYTIDGTVKLGHMQPDLATFKREVERLGLTRNDHLLVYDSVGIFSAPRAAWLLNAYGHPKVSVLDGGLPRWIKEDCPIESGPSPIIPDRSEYELAGFDENSAREKVISYEDLVLNFKKPIHEERMIVFDARLRARFLGTDPEPRPGLSSGHIPESLSLPFTSLLTQPSTSDPYPPEKLDEVFLKTLNNDQSKWDQIKNGQKGVIVSCGSGMTACIIWLALSVAHGSHPGSNSLQSVKLFDESWTGYALRKNSVIVTDLNSKTSS
ncbi:hypothetical protein PSTT_01762 [Puccinia striiformis]|uniref:Rhodanese domain-containing protein n=1 Tax=Puccinia striiformis TaxID=27350 RepID=A0A2S4W2I2_9BASI|nr:hypothetical protein PSTT_01762 [Puccinia striiformis]